MTFGNRFFLVRTLINSISFIPFWKGPSRLKSFDSLFHVLFLTKEVKSLGVYWLQKKGGHIWWIGQDINWKKPPIHTMHNILWYFFMLLKNIHYYYRFLWASTLQSANKSRPPLPWLLQVGRSFFSKSWMGEKCYNNGFTIRTYNFMTVIWNPSIKGLLICSSTSWKK